MKNFVIVSSVAALLAGFCLQAQAAPPPPPIDAKAVAKAKSKAAQEYTRAVKEQASAKAMQVKLAALTKGTYNSALDSLTYEINSGDSALAQTAGYPTGGKWAQAAQYEAVGNHYLAYATYVGLQLSAEFAHDRYVDGMQTGAKELRKLK